LTTRVTRRCMDTSRSKSFPSIHLVADRNTVAFENINASALSEDLKESEK
jgi:hypothetical protein